MTRDPLKVATERLTPRLEEELGDLLHRHWLEVARDHDRIPLIVDWPAYRRLDDAGTLITYTARRGQELVG